MANRVVYTRGGGCKLYFRVLSIVRHASKHFQKARKLLEAWPASIYGQLREGYLRKRSQIKESQKRSQIKKSAHFDLPSVATFCLLNVATATSNYTLQQLMQIYFPFFQTCTIICILYITGRHPRHFQKNLLPHSVLNIIMSA